EPEWSEINEPLRDAAEPRRTSDHKVAAKVRRSSVAPRRRLARALAVVLALGGLLLGGVIYVQTGSGTLKIETADDDVQVLVEQGGMLVRTIDKKTGTEVVLEAGVYQLRLGEERKDIRLSHDRIEIMRNRTAVATITRVSKPPEPSATPRSTMAKPRS